GNGRANLQSLIVTPVDSLTLSGARHAFAFHLDLEIDGIVRLSLAADALIQGGHAGSGLDSGALQSDPGGPLPDGPDYGRDKQPHVRATTTTPPIASVTPIMPRCCFSERSRAVSMSERSPLPGSRKKGSVLVIRFSGADETNGPLASPFHEPRLVLRPRSYR